MVGNQMKYQRIVVALLQLVLVTTATAQQPAKEKVRELSVAEEREARALAEDFIARFEASGDIATLLPMFTSDFRKRLRYVGGDLASPIAQINEAVINHASEEDLLRCYAESINFSYLVARHYGAALWLRKQAGRDDSDHHDHLTFKDVLPAEVITLLQSDPVIRNGFLREEQASDSKNDDNESLSRESPPDGSTQNESLSESTTSASQKSEPPDAEGEDYSIKTVAELNNYIRTLQQTNSILRKSARSLVTVNAVAKAFRELESAGKPTAEGEDLLNPRPFVLSDEWLNYPARQRFICIDALLFHMDLVRVEGRLQVAAIYFTSSCA